MPKEEKPLSKATVVYWPQSGQPVGKATSQSTCAQQKTIECGLPMVPAFKPAFNPQKKQPSPSKTPMLGDESKKNKVVSLMGKKEDIPGIYGTRLPVSTFSHQASHLYGLETGSSAEKKFHPSEDKPATGGIISSKLYKDYYKNAAEQLATLNMSTNSRTAQLNSNSSKQGQSHSWNDVPKQGNNSVSRDFSKPCAEMPSTSSDVPRNVIHTNPLVQSFMKRQHPVSYPGTKKTTSERNSRNGNGDLLKKTHEATTCDSHPATDSSGDDMRLANKLKLKKRNGNVERKLSVEEKAATETQKRNKSLLEKLKNVNLNLKPDPFEHKEDDVPSSSAENEMEPLATLKMSKNSRTAQLNSNSSKQGQSHSWNDVPKQVNNSVSRDFSKPCAEMPSTSSDVPRNVIHTNPLVQSFMKRQHPVSYPGTKKTTSERNSRNGNGDLLKKTHEATTCDSHPATDSSGDDMRLANKLKLKKRNGNVERKLSVAEKAATETEKKNKSLLEKLKNLNLNLKPDPFEHKEDDVPSSSVENETFSFPDFFPSPSDPFEHKEDDVPSSSAENETFSYPDFLPSPYNNLDLKKMSLSKSDDWKSSIKPPLSAKLGKLVSRLVDMERLQHTTILRERAGEAICPAVAARNRTILTKELPRSKQPRPLNCRQAKRDDGDVHNSSCGGQQTDMPKSQQSHNHKNSAPSMHSSSKTTRASCSNFKSNKTPVVPSSSNVVARQSLSCSGSSSKICPDVKLNSTNVESPGTTAACSLPDSESSKYKQTETKKKDIRKKQSEKLKPVSLISKQKSSNVDPQ